MLAIATADGLTVADPAALKRSPSSLPTSLSIGPSPSATCWAPDSSFLAITTGCTIQRYEHIGNSLQEVHVGAQHISCLIVQDRQTIYFSDGQKIHQLEGTTVTQTFGSHKSPILSLALSNDLSTLISASSEAIYLRDLAQSSTTALRGLPPDITTCVFHPHHRSRLLVGSGKQLVVYDTTRPSAPTKTVDLGEGVVGSIAAIACSPFSKTLVACCTSGGNVCLVDLEKEKGLFRSLNLKVPLTSTAFSPEGAAVYLGTEQGKLFILDLRALDKPPKSILVGAPIISMSVQKKAPSSSESSAKPTSTSAGPSRAKVAKIGESASAVASPARRVPSSLKPSSAPSAPTPRKSATAGGAKVVSPARTVDANTKRGIESKSATPIRSRLSATLPRSPLATGTSTNVMSSISTATLRGAKGATAPRMKDSTGTRSRTLSSGAGTGESASARLPARTTSGTARSTSSSRPTAGAKKSGNVPPVPPLPKPRDEARPFESPVLPGIDDDPITPVRTTFKPAISRSPAEPEPEDIWVQAAKESLKSKGKAKSVGFQDLESDEEGDKENLDLEEGESERSLVISPRRPSHSRHTSASWVPSPLRKAASPSGSASKTQVEEFLRTIMRDVMYDFQRETRAELTGLHLDLLKAGRGWKKEVQELREAVIGSDVEGDGLGELGRLRRENERLRDEVERLRRGY